MRLVFMGTPAFAVPSLQALVDAGHEIAAVYTRPPQPARRGQRMTPSPVQDAAEALGLPVRTAGLRTAEEQADFAALGADAAVVAAYGVILRPPVLAAPRLGCINVHASLLPRWRGAAPIQRALLAGDAVTGITIMLMEAGLDTGPMLAHVETPIAPQDTGGSLHDRLAAYGAGLLEPTLEGYARGEIRPVPQPDEGVTYAPKLAREEAKLDWRKPAEQLAREVRAFNPAPASWFELDGAPVKVLVAEVADKAGPPGTVLDGALTIACGTASLQPLVVQRPGRAAMETAAFLRGRAMPAGTLLP